MAQKVVVSLVDDLDGGQADQTVQFGFDGRNYEIDLSSNNADKLRAAMADYVAAARRASASRRGGKTAAGSASTTAVDREQNQAIREWARKRGMNVSERGRIPADVLEAYHQEK
ncbi:histone-like nucleoid-structuring protein Lsr2 [Pseudonocardia spinosispora]|uniref:histone-like nucleoid-structuring protein Lsr2 n=1 Tax=Pseudonocardia spinosispora TaxID=103441 RepID=UPI000425E1C9|nr:Lsr2 family protein [Pseudonocardia spinosispora]